MSDLIFEPKTKSIRVLLDLFLYFLAIFLVFSTENQPKFLKIIIVNNVFHLV